jgi:hypothetical protein
MCFARFCSAANGWDELVLVSVLVNDGLTTISPDGGCVLWTDMCFADLYYTFFGLLTHFC